VPFLRRTAVHAAPALLALTLAMGCGHHHASAPVDPKALLGDAKRTLDNTQAAHFALGSQDVNTTNAAVMSGEGDVARPDKFKGTMTVQGGAFSGRVDVLSAGGVFYVKLPLVGFTKVDPHDYGFGDPGLLLDPDRGITTFLTTAKNAEYRDRKRVNAEVVDVVHAAIPGQQVADVLTLADPSSDVDATFYITPDKAQVRQVVLTGPFFEKGQNSTYTLTLTNYGENVSISAPK